MPERLPFTIWVARVGPDADVTIAGDLDIITLPTLTDALARLRGTTPGSLALNLAGVDFIDCGCARAITAACQAWPGPGPGQAVSGDASPIVHQVFQVTGLAAAVHMDGSGITIPRQAAPGGEQGDGDGVGPSQLAAQLGTPVASLYRARELGLLPKPSTAGRWPPDTADGIARRWPQTTAVVEAARDLGAPAAPRCWAASPACRSPPRTSPNWPPAACWPPPPLQEAADVPDQRPARRRHRLHHPRPAHPHHHPQPPPSARPQAPR